MLNEFRYSSTGFMPLCTIFAAFLTACGGGESASTGAADVSAPADVSATVQSTALRVSIRPTSKLAVEGGSFSVNGVQTVRYGADSRWITKSVVGTGQCTNAFFGRDPALNKVKSCELVGNVQPVLPTVTPVLSLVSTTSPAPTATNAPAPAPAPAPASPSQVAAAQASSLMPVINTAKLIAKAAGSSTLDISPTTEVAPDSDSGAFRTICSTSHMGFDDPIVYPGQTGRSHLHTFFGNTGTSAGSTPDSIRTSGNSTCRGGIANRSAYWVPTMVDTKDGTPLVPDDIGVYYKSGQFDGSLVNPLPEGLRMIAGDPGATAPRGQWADFSYRFKCIGGPNNENDKYGSEIPNCDAGAQVWQEIMFPQCWDGVNLDSPDHKSHMSYLTQDQSPPFATHCPSTHPVILPAITFNIVYTVTAKDAPLRWRLASDNYDNSKPGGYSSHGDWFNGWQKDVRDAFVNKCIRAKKDCHSHLLGDGRMML